MCVWGTSVAIKFAGRCLQPTYEVYGKEDCGQGHFLTLSSVAVVQNISDNFIKKDSYQIYGMLQNAEEVGIKGNFHEANLVQIP